VHVVFDAADLLRLFLWMLRQPLGSIPRLRGRVGERVCPLGECP
jgi:hypothetical protein